MKVMTWGNASSGARRVAARALALVTVVGGGLVAATPVFALGAISHGSHLAISPGRAAVGTTVTIAGRLAPSDRSLVRGSSTVTLYIASGQRHAGLEAAVPGRATLSAQGVVRVTFTVPDRIAWTANPMSGSHLRLDATPVPSVIVVAWPCRACAVGRFAVTHAKLPMTGFDTATLVEGSLLVLAAGTAAVAIASPARARHLSRRR
jgi:hypothetical protein